MPERGQAPDERGTAMVDEASVPPTAPVETEQDKANKRWGARILMGAGLFLLYTGVAALAAGALYTWSLRGIYRAQLYQYLPELLAYSVGIFSAAVGVRLVRAAGVSPSDPLPVVNPKEWMVLATAIVNGKQDPITQYIRLSSLTGSTGWFTKLGLSGLPLATIGLTLFFASCTLFSTKPDTFHDLTQLTLGAFIGSFVQKQAEVAQEREALKRNPLAPTSDESKKRP